MPQKKIAPRTISPWMIAPWIIPPRTVAPKENCSLPPTIAPEENCLPGNCPLTIKFSLKIVAPTQANSPQRVLRVNWGKLCIVYEHYNIPVLQLKSKNRFASIYFLQILTKPCRTPLIIEHLSVNASWFSSARTQKKYNFLEKLLQKKLQTNFIVNNNNRTIRAWYLREIPGEHTYFPKKTEILLIKMIRN